jgi:transcriptional regulator with XRE-family HTH domain
MNRAELKSLKTALKSRGWTQEALAARIGRTQGHISQVLLGRRYSRALLAELSALSKQDAPAISAKP